MPTKESVRQTWGKCEEIQHGRRKVKDDQTLPTNENEEALATHDSLHSMVCTDLIA